MRKKKIMIQKKTVQKYSSDSEKAYDALAQARNVLFPDLSRMKFLNRFLIDSQNI